MKTNPDAMKKEYGYHEFIRYFLNSFSERTHLSESPASDRFANDVVTDPGSIGHRHRRHARRRHGGGGGGGGGSRGAFRRHGQIHENYKKKTLIKADLRQCFSIPIQIG